MEQGGGVGLEYTFLHTLKRASDGGVLVQAGCPAASSERCYTSGTPAVRQAAQQK